MAHLQASLGRVARVPPELLLVEMSAALPAAGSGRRLLDTNVWAAFRLTCPAGHPTADLVSRMTAPDGLVQLQSELRGRFGAEVALTEAPVVRAATPPPPTATLATTPPWSPLAATTATSTTTRRTADAGGASTGEDDPGYGGGGPATTAGPPAAGIEEEGSGSMLTIIAGGGLFGALGLCGCLMYFGYCGTGDGDEREVPAKAKRREYPLAADPLQEMRIMIYYDIILSYTICNIQCYNIL